MTDPANQATQPGTDEFVWHPEYIGKSFESVQDDLAKDIDRDQRAYHHALENAEKEEYDAFNTIRELERRWSDCDFGWFDLPPEELADRVLAFEVARDERQELISWQDWKAENIPLTHRKEAVVSDHKPDWRENLTDEQRKRLASGLSVLIILGLIAVCGLIYLFVR